MSFGSTNYTSKPLASLRAGLWHSVVVVAASISAVVVVAIVSVVVAPSGGPGL